MYFSIFIKWDKAVPEICNDAIIVVHTERTFNTSYVDDRLCLVMIWRVVRLFYSQTYILWL